MFDFARLRSLHKGEFTCLISLLAKLGYQELGLYIEGAFLPERNAGAIREEVLEQEDADWILKEAAEHGMSVLPMTNVLYHMEHFQQSHMYISYF